MNRWFLVLLIAAVGSSAAAQDWRFGARLALDASGLVGVQVRADFGGRNTDGFGVRVVARTWFLLSAVNAFAYYRLVTDELGSCAYFGAGGGVTLAPNLLGDPSGTRPTVFVTPFVNAVVGYERALSERVSLFVELRPAWLISGASFAIAPAFGLGLNYYF
jgi:hypothetical protein